MSKKNSHIDFIDQLKCRSNEVKNSLLDYFSNHETSDLHPWRLVRNWFFPEKKPSGHQPFSGQHLFSDDVLALLKTKNTAINDDILFVEKELIDRRLCQWRPYHLLNNKPINRTELWLKRESAQSKHARWKVATEITLGMRYLPSIREASHWGDAIARKAIYVIPTALLINGCLFGLQKVIPSFTLDALGTAGIAVSITAAVLFITVTLVFYGTNRHCDTRHAKTLLDQRIYRSEANATNSKPALTDNASHNTGS